MPLAIHFLASWFFSMIWLLTGSDDRRKFLAPTRSLSRCIKKKMLADWKMSILRIGPFPAQEKYTLSFVLGLAFESLALALCAHPVQTSPGWAIFSSQFEIGWARAPTPQNRGSLKLALRCSPRLFFTRRHYNFSSVFLLFANRDFLMKTWRKKRNERL